MNIFSLINQNFQKGKYYFIIGISVLTLILCSTELIHQLRGIPYEDLTRDPNEISSQPKYIGFVSQIGIFFWFGAVSICILGFILLQRFTENTQHVRYLKFFSFFSFVLGVDDVFMLHDESAHRGINEEVVYLIYIFSFIYFIVKFWSLVFKTNFNLLFISGFLLGTSIFIDKFNPSAFLLEDSLKLGGIIFWFLYFLDTTISFLTSVLKNKIQPQ